MRWFPTTKIGKISFWVGVGAFILLYLQYWYAMLFQTSVSPVLGLLPMLCILAAGVGSVVALTKYRDRAILLFLSAGIGALALLFLVGEFLFPH
jgi:hypothetical protein